MANINNINSGIDYSVFFGGSSSNSSTGKVSGTAAGDNDVTQVSGEKKSTGSASESAGVCTEKSAVYEKSADALGSDTAKNTYKADKKQIDQIKAVFESKKKQLQDVVDKLISGQARSFDVANGKNLKNMYAGLTVDAKTRAQAQADIAEDGYWGVTQTSQRIFDFAMALSGGDPEKMEQMRTAFEKGFKKAAKAWGDALPDICHRTYDAVESLFDDYKEKQDKAAEEVQA